MNTMGGNRAKSDGNYDSALLAEAGTIKPIFIILVDISGYTRFIKYHRISLLHAEKIVALLMESILEQVQFPIMAHEILGDAISLYALDEGKPGQANDIYIQLMKYFTAFREREAMLISECSICKCEACREIGKLKLKAILHLGQAAFTKIFNTEKISGEDVIISHRLLKNSVPSDEYILMTENFFQRCTQIDQGSLTKYVEYCEGIGKVNTRVHNFAPIPIEPAVLSFREKVRGLWAVEKYMIRRFFRPASLRFKNLPKE